MPAKKLRVERDQEAEGLYGVEVVSASVFLDGRDATVIGELVACDGSLDDEYREIQVVLYDAEGDIVGRGYTNWSEFGVRQSFSLCLLHGDDLHGVPAAAKVFPSAG